MQAEVPGMSLAVLQSRMQSIMLTFFPTGVNDGRLRVRKERSDKGKKRNGQVLIEGQPSGIINSLSQKLKYAFLGFYHLPYRGNPVQ